MSLYFILKKRANIIAWTITIGLIFLLVSRVGDIWTKILIIICGMVGIEKFKDKIIIKVIYFIKDKLKPKVK